MDLVKNAADPKQVNTAKKKERSRHETELMDMQHVLSSLNGRRFIWKYLAVCGMFETSFSTEPGRTFFNEGQRNVGLKLMADINDADPAAYGKMMKEYKGEMYA